MNCSLILISSSNSDNLLHPINQSGHSPLPPFNLKTAQSGSSPQGSANHSRSMKQGSGSGQDEKETPPNSGFVLGWLSWVVWLHSRHAQLHLVWVLAQSVHFCLLFPSWTWANKIFCLVYSTQVCSLVCFPSQASSSIVKTRITCIDSIGVILFFLFLSIEQATTDFISTSRFLLLRSTTVQAAPDKLTGGTWCSIDGTTFNVRSGPNYKK